MANPSVVACTASAWTVVATNITTGSVEVIKDTVQYLITYVDTGDPAPTLIGVGAALDNEAKIRSSTGIDVYVWAVGDEDGSVRLYGSSDIVGDGGVTTVSVGSTGTSDVNLVEVVGTATNVNGGNRDAGTQTVTLADDDPAVASVASIDTKTPALGAAAMAASSPTTIATDDTHFGAVGAAADVDGVVHGQLRSIGEAVEVAAGWDNGASDGASVSGDVAHDAADAGEPVKIGVVARTAQAVAVDNGDRVDATGNIYGEIALAGHTWATQSHRTEEVNALSQQYVSPSRVDTTNVSATTHYYPDSDGSTIDGYKALSATMKFIDADGTLTLTLEATNDEDTAAGDWHDVTKELSCGASNNPAYDGTTGNASYTVTNGTLTAALSVDDFNYESYRWVVVASGATNTVIIKERTRAL